MKYPYLLAALITLFALPSQAAVYKCVINGVPTYSQLPCGEDAQIVDVRYTKSSKKEQPEAQDSQPEVSDVDSFLVSQNIDRQIQQHQKNIKEYEQMLDEQLTQIGYINQATANYLGAASIGDAIKQQSTLAKTNIGARIKNEENAIAQLRKMKENINAAAESDQPL